MSLPLGLTYKKGWLPGLVTLHEWLIFGASCCKSHLYKVFPLSVYIFRLEFITFQDVHVGAETGELSFQNMSHILIVYINASEKNHELPQVT